MQKRDRRWADPHRDLHGFERIFSHTTTISALQYIQYYKARDCTYGEKSSPQNCKALQNERFFRKTSKETTARLTPAVVFWCSIAEKDPVWSV